MKSVPSLCTRNKQWLQPTQTTVQRMVKHSRRGVSTPRNGCTVTSLHKMLPSTTSRTNQAGGALQEQDHPHRIKSMLHERLSTQDKYHTARDRRYRTHSPPNTHSETSKVVILYWTRPWDLKENMRWNIIRTTHSRTSSIENYGHTLIAIEEKTWSPPDKIWNTQFPLIKTLARKINHLMTSTSPVLMTTGCCFLTCGRNQLILITQGHESVTVPLCFRQ